MNSIDKLITELHSQLIEKEQKINELQQRIDKAKEYVKKEEHSNWVLYGRNVLLKILGDKENE